MRGVKKKKSKWEIRGQVKTARRHEGRGEPTPTRMMGMKRIARIVLLMDSLCKSWTARLFPLISATLLCVKVGEQAEHLNLDLAELRLSEEVVEV